MSDVGFAPKRMVDVVADARHTAVSFDLTFGRLQRDRAVVGDDGLGGVDQGQALRDGVL